VASPRLLEIVPENIAKVIGNFDSQGSGIQHTVASPRLLEIVPENIARVIGNFDQTAE